MSNKEEKAGKHSGRRPLVPRLRFPEFRETGEWEGVLLGEICQPQQWPTISSTDLVDVGYPVYGANGFIGYYNSYNHEFETVAVTCRGSTCGEVLLIPKKSYVTGNSMCLDGIEAAQNSYHFVFHLLKYRGFNDVISGSAQPQIVGNAIKRVKITLPELKEQQKIADCLSSLDDLITLESQKLNALKTHKKGLMQQLFPAGGETVPRLRFPEFREAGEWETKPFEELFIIGNGKDYKHLSNGEVPVYGSGGYMLSVNDHLHDGESVCIGRKGTINSPMFLTGKFWAVDTLFYTHSFTDCLPRFIYSIFQNVDWLKHNEAGGVPSLSKTNIGKIKVAVPKLKEQQKIADCLSSLDDLITAQAQKVEVLKTHKKGLMQQLFPPSP